MDFDVIVIHMILFQHAAIQSTPNIPRVCSFSCQVRKKNVLKDFVTVAGPLGVTHFMIFSKTQSGINMVRLEVSKQNMAFIFTISNTKQQRRICAFRDLPDFPKVPCFISGCSR